MSEWISSFASSAMKYADSLADSLVMQANEAQATIETEQRKLKEEEDAKKRLLSGKHALPWETDNEDLTILSQDAMERILKLSLTEENFTVPPTRVSEQSFSFDEFIPIATKLLRLDTNLARIHARLSPKMDEQLFWQHYHYRIMYIRASVGLDGQEGQQSALGSQLESDVAIFQPTFQSEGKKNNVTKLRAATASSSSSSSSAIASSSSSSSSSVGEDDDESKATCAPSEEERLAKERQKEEALLAAEVEAELENRDIDLADLGDLDLGEDELEDDDLGVLALDDGDELEAQISLELEASKK